MDFKGETPAEAAEQLQRFLISLANPRNEESAHKFRFAVSADGALLTRLKGKSESKRNFGTGHFIGLRTVLKFQLARDAEGWYRWLRIPARINGLGHVSPLPDAHSFPLLSDYLEEIIAEEPVIERKVLAMK